MDLKQTVGEGVDSGQGKWRAVVNARMNLRLPYNAENFSTTYGTIGFLRHTVHCAGDWLKCVSHTEQLPRRLRSPGYNKSLQLSNQTLGRITLDTHSFRQQVQ
jgi:hypothetical protein